MKTFVAAISIMALSATAALAQNFGSSYGHNSNNFGGYGTGSNSSNHYVQPHYNSNGGVTSGHYQTNPNNTQLDNYGTRGNVNPYTGARGTRTPNW